VSDKQRRFAENVQKSGKILLSVISDILDFSKLEAGKLELEAVDFDLSEVVSNVVEILTEQAHKKGIELACLVRDEEFSPRVPFIFDEFAMPYRVFPTLSARPDSEPPRRGH
jgi:signal transduction histidine kinase